MRCEINAKVKIWRSKRVAKRIKSDLERTTASDRCWEYSYRYLPAKRGIYDPFWCDGLIGRFRCLDLLLSLDLFFRGGTDSSDCGQTHASEIDLIASHHGPTHRIPFPLNAWHRICFHRRSSALLLLASDGLWRAEVNIVHLANFLGTSQLKGNHFDRYCRAPIQASLRSVLHSNSGWTAGLCPNV